MLFFVFLSALWVEDCMTRVCQLLIPFHSKFWQLTQSDQEPISDQSHQSNNLFLGICKELNSIFIKVLVGIVAVSVASMTIAAKNSSAKFFLINMIIWITIKQLMLISKYLKPNCLWDDDLQQGNIDETSRHTQKKHTMPSKNSYR